MRKVNLTTKLIIIVGFVSTVIATISSYIMIQIVFAYTENQIKNGLISKHKEVALLSSPDKNADLSNYLRSNDLNLFIFNDQKQVVARYGIYRNISDSSLNSLTNLAGYQDKNIENFGNYDTYTEGGIQISIKNSLLSILDTAFGLNLLALFPIALIISVVCAVFVTKLVLSPLTKAEDISHELKTPLTRAVGSLQIISDQSPKRLKGSLNSVTQELIQLGRNVDTLLTLSLYKKQGSAAKKYSHVLTEFGKIKSIVPQNINFKYKIYRNLDIPLSPNYLNIVLRNLFDNAVKYNKTGGFINFKAGKIGDNWLIEIENSKGKKSGKISYGIGMLIVKEICHFQKLNIHIANGEDVFSVKITGVLT